MRKLILVLGMSFGFLLLCCGPATKEKPKLDRELLGEELQFGREAAQFELWNEAIFRWEKVLHEAPQNVEALNNLAVAYESVGNYAKADELYKTALEIDEDSRAVRKNYKRFLNFYKKHQRQLKREERHRQEQAEAESEDQGDPETPKKEEQE